MGNVRWEGILVLLVLEAMLIGTYAWSVSTSTDARRDALDRMCWTYGNATGKAYDVLDGDKYYVVLCSDNPRLREYVENMTGDVTWVGMARSRS